LGALFVAPKTIQTKRATVEKFLRAYRRGAADCAVALLRHDRYGKCVSDSASQGAAMTIAPFVYPGNSAATVEAGAYYIEPQARLDSADIEHQLAWYKAQGLVEPSVETRNVLDLSFLN
jgi:NitT/TauT family transport system substrate-binding protein